MLAESVQETDELRALALATGGREKDRIAAAPFFGWLTDGLPAHPVALALQPADKLEKSLARAVDANWIPKGDYRQVLEAAQAARRHRPLFLIDIAVPRDIDPDVGRLKDVYLYTIDDLQQVVDENLQQRAEAAQAAGQDVDEAVGAFMRWLYGIRAARTLKRIREQSHEFERDLTERAIRRLRSGQDPEAVLQQMANTLTNKILHLPSKHLRQAAEQQDYEVLKAADRIFRREDEPDDGT